MNLIQPPPSSPPAAKTSGLGHLTIVFRVVIILLLVFSVWLVWWSYYRVYAPRLKEARDNRATVNQLSAEVEDLDRRWPPAEIERINQRFEQVDTSLFADQSMLEAWLADFRERLLPPLALDLSASFQNTVLHSAAGQKVQVIPTTLTVELRPVTNATVMPSPYQRLLELTRKITLQPKRADLTEMTVESGPNSVSRAVLVLNFWARGKEPK